LEKLIIKRINISILIFIITCLTVYFFGAMGFMGLVFFFGLLTQREFYKLLQKMGKRPLVTTIIFCDASLIDGSLYIKGLNPIMPYHMKLLRLSIIIVMIQVLLSHSLNISKSCIISKIIGIIYIQFKCCFLILLYHEMIHYKLSNNHYHSISIF
jgi:CDP-diglyceride synthetase